MKKRNKSGNNKSSFRMVWNRATGDAGQYPLLPLPLISNLMFADVSVQHTQPNSTRAGPLTTFAVHSCSRLIRNFYLPEPLGQLCNILLFSGGTAKKSLLLLEVLSRSLQSFQVSPVVCLFVTVMRQSHFVEQTFHSVRNWPHQ